MRNARGSRSGVGQILDCLNKVILVTQRFVVIEICYIFVKKHDDYEKVVDFSHSLCPTVVSWMR